MTQEQKNKLNVIQAKADLVSEIYELICRTIEETYTRYYPNEAVRFFLELHSEENILKDISDGKVYAVTHEQDVIGTLTYHVGGEVYVMNHNNQVGFVKGEMCSPGIATQAEDLIAAGAWELIHVGFAGGRVGTRIGDVVITDGAFNDTAIAGLYGYSSEIVETSKVLTDSFCKEMDSKGITYHRGYHWTTDAGYVETNWRIKYFEDKGALCVEMEGAGLFSVAKFRSCHATGI